MNERVDNQQFDELLSRFVDSDLQEPELQQLVSLIESDRTLRHKYLESCQLHGLLRAEHGLLASWGVSAVELSSYRLVGKLRAPRALALWSTAAVLLISLLGGVLHYGFSKLERPFRGEVVAKLKNQVRAEFAYGPLGESTPPVGAAMLQGPYQLLSGIIELESVTGVVLTVEAPASFTLLDDQGFRIDDGRVAAHVPESARGFRVVTPSATVVDLGTDFAVESTQRTKSEVHVFNGEVQINLRGSKASKASPLRLTTGKATRIDYETGMPSGIDLDEQRFLRGLDVEPRAYTSRVLSMQPTAYYPMQPTGDGMLLMDATTQRSDARIHFGHAAEPVWAAGKVGLAFALGGPAQETYASVGSYLQAEGNQLSVVAWVMAQSRPRWASIAKNWAGADDRGQFHFGLYMDSGELEAHIQDSTNKEITVKDNVPLPLNMWHHVAFVADGSMLRLYRNGQEVAAAEYRQLQSNPRIKALAIGTKLNLRGEAPEERDFNMWDGRLDELAIFNHALTANQVLELYELAGEAD